MRGLLYTALIAVAGICAINGQDDFALRLCKFTCKINDVNAAIVSDREIADSNLPPLAFGHTRPNTEPTPSAVRRTFPSFSLIIYIKSPLLSVIFPCFASHLIRCIVALFYTYHINITRAQTAISSLQAYDNLNNGMGAEELYDTHCAGLVDVPKCISNCYERLKIDQPTEDKELEETNRLKPEGQEIVDNNCLKIREKFSNLEPVFDCAKKIYPLIAEPEENAKCRKMCCSKASDKAGVYACNQREGFQQWVTDDYASSAEDMCQFACVIDQAAKHAYDKCSLVLAEMLFVARQDVQKIYQDLERGLERKKNQGVVILDADSTTISEPTTPISLIKTTTPSMPTKVNPLKQHLFKVGGYNIAEKSNF